MVTLTEIADDAVLTTDEEQSDSDDDSSSSSVSSVTSSLEDETLFERLEALKDIIPYHRRQLIAHRVDQAASTGMRVLKFVGNIGWILVTSAVLVIVPLAVEMERDAQQKQWEKEMRMQQQSLEGSSAGVSTGGAGPGMSGIPGYGKAGVPAGF